ncbi:hypothetical protein PG999_009807 [Apiospora kogelbergensis]|uniref:Uncharacterized protein n=1 Tax=Apiospora kogelbergensis TaxID=1337665 RepID=A0AAW0QTR5_9PEZI
MPSTATLPSRYEIRPLGPEHVEWAKAIVTHSNAFGSPVWSALYPGAAATRVGYRVFAAMDHMVEHQIASGHSLGLFDAQYQYKRAESAAAGGRLWWDMADLEADGDALLRQMDFPLLSVALAYDGFVPFDAARIEPVAKALRGFGESMRALEARDGRDPASWKPKGPGQLLLRNATATKLDEAGKGLMKHLAHRMMRQAAEDGFRGIQIEAYHDAVRAVWANPPAPFKGEVVSSINAWTWGEEDESGELVYLLRPSKQDCSKIYVTLKEQ